MDIVFSTLFPAVKLSNVLSMSWPKGLHSGKTATEMTSAEGPALGGW